MAAPATSKAWREFSFGSDAPTERMIVEELFPGLTSAPNLHPMVVHFPIAFWLAAAGAWVVGLLRKNDVAWRFGLWLHTMGLASAAVAIAFGYWATSETGHDAPGHDLVHVHRDLMLWTTAVAVVVTGLGWWKRSARFRSPLVLLSLVLVGFLSFGADRGAALVFQYGMGVASEPPPETEHSHGHGDDEHGSSHDTPGEHCEDHGSQVVPSSPEAPNMVEPESATEVPTAPSPPAPHGRDHAH